MKSNKNLGELKSKQKADLILANPIFHTKVRILRLKWKIPQDGFSLEKPIETKTKEGVVLRQRVKGKMEKWQDRLNKSGKSPDFWKDLDNLKRTTLKPYKLSDRWLWFLQRYIVYGSKIPEGGLEIKLRIDDDTGGYSSIWIKIDGDTTLDDIRRGWRNIKRMQKRLLNYKERFKVIKKLQRDKRVWELTKQKLSNEEIAEKIKKEFGGSLKYFDVAKIKSKYKKRHRL